MTATPDYSTWLTKAQAAERIGVTTKSVERFVQAGQIQQARWQRDGRGPLLAVYHPDDVEKIAQERRPGPLPPFLVPGPTVPSNGNGQHPDSSGRQAPNALTLAPPIAAPPDDILRLMFAAALRAVSETSETSRALFLTLDEAAAVSGLSRACLRNMISAGTLAAIRDRGWKIRRKDLEAL